MKRIRPFAYVSLDLSSVKSLTLFEFFRLKKKIDRRDEA